MKTSVKIQETHLESKKNEELQKFSAKRRLGEDECKTLMFIRLYMVSKIDI